MFGSGKGDETLTLPSLGLVGGGPLGKTGKAPGRLGPDRGRRGRGCVGPGLRVDRERSSWDGRGPLCKKEMQKGQEEKKTSRVEFWTT